MNRRMMLSSLIGLVCSTLAFLREKKRRGFRKIIHVKVEDSPNIRNMELYKTFREYHAGLRRYLV